MAKLIYIANTSLDGYIEDRHGDFSWGNPEQVFSVITELLRPIGTHLYGRRLYETMAYWDAPILEGNPSEHAEFAQIWQRAEKVVYSRTLTQLVSPNSRLESTFDVDAVRNLKRDSKHDITIGGAELAGLAIEAELVDECHLFINPVVLGEGKPAFRVSSARRLELLEMRCFDTGVVHARYGVGGRLPQWMMRTGAERAK